MKTISIHLQEGFEGDTVTLMAGGRLLAEKDFVTTRNTIGFATKIDVQVGDEEMALRMIVRGLARRLETEIDIGDRPYLGVSVTKPGEIMVSRSEQAFCYM